ncbi:hypothetical protein HPQ32_14090 [Photobacterium carnosum]|uniref:hypothetical protein n=1 Tax=Photobacterium carnosum TaxID=2023717 RepID=UPI001C908285|nr:hypothetical protein [Photobacterium carnosum]MBY3789553.1 hypothetical protein [Photobacterium carnosum]MCD9534612.1 hypothetical protein [Photobacterium carnosum]
MQHDRALTAKLLIDAGMMDVVKQFASRFGNNGKLNDVAVITEKGAAYFGKRPTKTKRCNPLVEMQKVSTYERINDSK